MEKEIMGKLLDQIQATPVNSGGFQSTVDVAINNLIGEDKDDLVCALRNETISPSVISEVLKDNGIDVSRNAILRWRKREGI
jgi:hypothetical protein